MSFVAEIRITYDFVSVGSQGGYGGENDIIGRKGVPNVERWGGGLSINCGPKLDHEIAP